MLLVCCCSPSLAPSLAWPACLHSTTSGAFVVGDFFHINEAGYTLKQEAGKSTSSRPADSESATGISEPTPHDPAQITENTTSTQPGSTAIPSPTCTSASESAPPVSSGSSASPSTAASPTAAAATVAGGLQVTSLSDLIIMNPIGQGASGLVQRVSLRSNPGVHLALKVIPLDLSESKSKQILIELRTLHYAAHPNIVSFYGAFYKERSMSLVLEYMDRGSLADCLKRLKSAKLKQQKKRRERRLARFQQQQHEQYHLLHPDSTAPSPRLFSPPASMPSPDSTRLSRPLVEEAYISCVARQLLSGLHYLHATRRLIHRDIKPSNVLLNSSGCAKLADFGVSGELQEAAGNENKISFVGTVTFMSPERIQGHPHSFDSDLWSLGLLLVEMATGEFPYAQPQEDGDAAEEVSSSDEESIASDSDTHDDEHKESRRRRAARSTTRDGLATIDSPSSSAASTPSHAAFSLASPTTAGSGSTAEFTLAVPASKENDLYNATQTHAPGLAMPSPPRRPITSPSSGVHHAAAIKRPTSSLSVHSSPQRSLPSTSPRMVPFSRPTSALGDVPSSSVASGNAGGGNSGTRRKSRSRFGFWDIMQRIVQSPAPTLTSRISRRTGREKYSPDFRSFVAACLKKETKERPTALQLLSHPFITRHADDKLEEWIRTIPERQQEVRQPATGVLTPSVRSSMLQSSPIHASFLASPSAAAPLVMPPSPLLSPPHSAALPPLPHRRHHRHHSISSSPRVGSAVTIAVGVGSSLGHLEEESEIETFPVTTTVNGFANAYDSVPIEGMDRQQMETHTHTDMSDGGGATFTGQPPAAAFTSHPLQTDGTPTPTSVTALSPTISVGVGAGSGVLGRHKRKPTSDIFVDVDSSYSPAAAATAAAAAQDQCAADWSASFSHARLTSYSAPSSMRSDVDRALAHTATTPRGASASAVGSPPSGRVAGATPLKRQKSADDAIDHRSTSRLESEERFGSFSSVAPPTSTVVQLGLAIPTGPVGSVAPVAGRSASATFAANLRLVTAQRFETMHSLQHAHRSVRDAAATCSSGHVDRDDVDDDAARATGPLRPGTCTVSPTAIAPGPSLSSPLTPATATKLTHFSLMKDDAPPA